MAAPSEGEAPSPCEAVDAAMRRLDLRSLSNGLRSHLDDGGPMALDDLFDPEFAPYCGGAVVGDGHHVVGVTALAVGDCTGAASPTPSP